MHHQESATVKPRIGLVAHGLFVHDLGGTLKL